MNKKIDFTNAEELLNLCEAKEIPISEAMLQREISKFEISREEAERRMLETLNVMRESVARSQTEKMKLLPIVVKFVVLCADCNFFCIHSQNRTIT